MKTRKVRRNPGILKIRPLWALIGLPILIGVIAASYYLSPTGQLNRIRGKIIRDVSDDRPVLPGDEEFRLQILLGGHPNLVPRVLERTLDENAPIRERALLLQGCHSFLEDEETTRALESLVEAPHWAGFDTALTILSGDFGVRLDPSERDRLLSLLESRLDRPFTGAEPGYDLEQKLDQLKARYQESAEKAEPDSEPAGEVKKNLEEQS